MLTISMGTDKRTRYPRHACQPSHPVLLTSAYTCRGLPVVGRPSGRRARGRFTAVTTADVPRVPQPDVRSRASVAGVEVHTSDLIIETALQFFSRYGYEGTSMRQIAGAVGVKPASLYNHYASKEDILWAIAQRAQDELALAQARVFEEVEDTVDRLETFVRMHVAFHARNPRRADITNSQLRSLSAQRWELVVAFRDSYERRLRSLLRHGHREGAFVVTEARITSYAILEMGMGVATWFRPDGPVSVSRLAGLHAQIALRMVGVDITTRRLLVPGQPRAEGTRW